MLSDVAWEDYEWLLHELGDSSHPRITYSNGRLEVMSPSTKHEKYKNLTNELVPALCYELEMDAVSFGSFTMKIWRYDGSRVSILQLVRGAYAGAEQSLCFPFLSADRLIELIVTLAPGTHQARRAVRTWVQANKPSAPTSK